MQTELEPTYKFETLRLIEVSQNPQRMSVSTYKSKSSAKDSPSLEEINRRDEKVDLSSRKVEPFLR